MPETRITREQLDREIGGEFVGERHVRVYQHPYGAEVVFDNGRRFLKLNKCNCGDFKDGRAVVAQVIHEALVAQTKNCVAALSSVLRLVCGEAVPAPADWDSCADVLKEMRITEAGAVFDNYEVFEEMPALPSWEEVTIVEEQDQGVSREGRTDSGRAC